MGQIYTPLVALLAVQETKCMLWHISSSQRIFFWDKRKYALIFLIKNFLRKLENSNAEAKSFVKTCNKVNTAHEECSISNNSWMHSCKVWCTSDRFNMTHLFIFRLISSYYRKTIEEMQGCLYLQIFPPLQSPLYSAILVNALRFYFLQ